MTDTQKQPTGIAGLDLTIEGGFPVGTRIIVYGTALSGLELLAQQFWKAGDEECRYLMLDAEPTGGMLDARELSLKELAAAMRGKRIVVDSLSTLIHNYGIDAAADFLTSTTEDRLREGSNVLFLLYRGNPFAGGRDLSHACGRCGHRPAAGTARQRVRTDPLR